MSHIQSHWQLAKKEKSVEMSEEPPVITFDALVTAGRNGFGAQTGSGNDPKSGKQQSKEPGYCCLCRMSHWQTTRTLASRHARAHTHTRSSTIRQVHYLGLISAKVSVPACSELVPDFLAQVPSGQRNSCAKMSWWEKENVTFVRMATWLDI